MLYGKEDFIMDVFDIVNELKELLNRFPKLTKIEIEKLRVLSNNLSSEATNILYDWGK